MLTKLLPDQISKFWDIIKYGIEHSLPPTVGEHPDKMNRILASLLSSKMQCWASYTKSEEGNKFEGIIITKLLYDDSSNTKNLLIYCLYGYENVDTQSWPNGFDKIALYAKSLGCAKVVAYTSIPHMIEVAKHLGADTSYTFVSFDLQKFVK